MNTLQRTFKFLKEKNDRSDRFEIIPAVGCFSADRRLSQLLKLGLLEKREIDKGHFEKPLTQYKITELGISTDLVDVKAPRILPKPKKTQEESIVKKESIEFNNCIVGRSGLNIKVRRGYQPVKEYTPPVKPTTFIGKLKYMYELWKSL